MNKINWPLMKNAISFKDKYRLIKFLITSDRYTNGPKVKEFEKLWAEWVGSKHALMVSSGSTANYLLIAAVKEKYGLKDKDKVLVPACTWVTNISPVFQCGFTPIFCDVNLTNFSFDLDHMKEIKKQHPDIKMIFVTHLLGFSAENEKYKEIFPDAIILDDVCESHGCRDTNGNRVGADTIGATFSFYFGHHMTTVEGGMVNTNDQELYDLMKMKRSHGLARESSKIKQYTEQYKDIHPQFLFMTDGYNFRSSDINAVLGISQLERLDKNIEIRRNNFTKFVNIIDQNLDKFYPVDNQKQNSNYAFPFICREQSLVKKMKDAFEANGIEHRPIVGGNLLKQPFLKNYAFGTIRSNPNVDVLNDNGVYIGNSHFVTDSDMDWLAEIVSSI